MSVGSGGTVIRVSNADNSLATGIVARNGKFFEIVCAKPEAEVTLKKIELVLRRIRGHKYIGRLEAKFDQPEIEGKMMAFGPFEQFDLFDLVRSFGGMGTTGVSIHVARQIILAVRDLHRRQVAHKDLKLEVVRLAEGTFDCQLTGLVHCMPTHTSEGKGRPTRHKGGTRAYAAPEALRKELHDPAKADMWSLGVLLFILVVGRPPCKVADESDTWFKCLQRKNKVEMDAYWSKHLKASKIEIDRNAVLFRNLVEGLLEEDPLKRMDAAAVVKHPWVCTVCPTQDICRGLIKAMSHRLNEKQRQSAQMNERHLHEEFGAGYTPDKHPDSSESSAAAAASRDSNPAGRSSGPGAGAATGAGGSSPMDEGGSWTKPALGAPSLPPAGTRSTAAGSEDAAFGKVELATPSHPSGGSSQSPSRLVATLPADVTGGRKEAMRQIFTRSSEMSVGSTDTRKTARKSLVCDDTKPESIGMVPDGPRALENRNQVTAR